MTKPRKPLKSDDYKRYLVEAAGYERDFMAEVVRSRTMAWRVAGVALLVGIVGFAAGIAGNRHPSPPPVVLRVDKATGAVDVLSTLDNAQIDYGQAVDESNINRFILLRESYDWNTIQSDYNTMGLFASPSVIADYEKLYNDNDGRQVKLANHAHIVAKVVSIILNPGTTTATVRFTTDTFHDNGSADSEKHWIATLAYQYVNAQMTVEQRRINPLGFQVVSYRVDPEIVK